MQLEKTLTPFTLNLDPNLRYTKNIIIVIFCGQKSNKNDNNNTNHDNTDTTLNDNNNTNNDNTDADTIFRIILVTLGLLKMICLFYHWLIHSFGEFTDYVDNCFLVWGCPEPNPSYLDRVGIILGMNICYQQL